MHLNHLVQVDMDGPGPGLGPGPGRFWMDSCGGRDQMAMAVLHGGWRACRPPLPALVAAWSRALRPVFVDAGANTGFHGLLALAAGAVRVHAFEPVQEIADVLAHNARMSELSAALRLHRVALGSQAGRATLYLPRADHGLVETSASLNAAFHTAHAATREVVVATLDQALADEPAGVPMLLKIAVVSREPDVLRGAAALLRRHRPAVVCELLPGADLAFFEHWCQAQGYSHYALDGGQPRAGTAIEPSMRHRDHLFLPNEAARPWLAALAPRELS